MDPGSSLGTFPACYQPSLRAGQHALTQFCKLMLGGAEAGHTLSCLLTRCSAPRPISSTPAAWRPGHRAASKSASSSLPGTAGTAPRGHCSSPATAGCAAVRKALDTTTGTPSLQVRARGPLLSSQVPPFLPHPHLGCASPRNTPEGSFQEAISLISSQTRAGI